MLKRLGKTITNNFSLKILAVILAVVLWVVVINIDDPTTSKTYTTNVVAENTDYITSQNKYYEPLDSSNVVSFRVSAARSVHDELSNADFSATADMENIEYDEGSGIYRVPVTITAKRYSNKVSVVSKQLYLEVALEDRGTCQKAITAATKGTVMDGCALGTVQIVGSNLLKVSGPASIVSQIDTAVATINVEGMSTDVTDSVVPVLYDADGNVIDTTKLTLSLSTVNISAQILNTKDVPLEFEAKGEPADGYVLTGVESSLDNVRIKGEAATLNTVSKITIPQEVLDISGITEDLTTTVDISSYLPSGTSLVLNSDAKVEVIAKVEPVVKATYEVPVANFTIQNVRDGYNANYMESTVAVEISGAESELAGISAKDITGTADASNLGAGEHHLNVQITLEQEHCWVIGTVTLPVTITDHNTAETGTSDNTDTTDSESKTNDTADTAAAGDAADKSDKTDKTDKTATENGAAGSDAERSSNNP